MFNPSARGSLSRVNPQLPFVFCHLDSAFRKVPNIILQNAASEALLWALMTHAQAHTHTLLTLSLFLPVVILSQAILTMLVTSGEAPFCSRRRTMFKWPMKAATCIGVRPDCGTKQQQFYSSALGALGLLQINKTSGEDRRWVRGRGRHQRGNVWWEAETLFYLCYSLDWSPIFHQQFHDFDAVFLAGNVQWSKTILCKRQSS